MCHSFVGKFWCHHPKFCVNCAVTETTPKTRVAGLVKTHIRRATTFCTFTFPVDCGVCNRSFEKFKRNLQIIEGIHGGLNAELPDQSLL
jgi:hypothetical protein